MNETPAEGPWDRYVEPVTTGQPEVMLLACRICGVLLWDIGKHYDFEHPGKGPQ